MTSRDFLVRWTSIAVVLCVVAWSAWYGYSHLQRLEQWLVSWGPWAGAVYVGLFLAMASLFVPCTLLSLTAGAVFGVAWGTLFVIVAIVTTASVNFLLGRWLLRHHVELRLTRYPRLRALRDAAEREGLGLIIPLRVSVLSPVLVSYLLGTSRLSYRTFMLGTMALFPVALVEVYLGSAARRASQLAARGADSSWLQNSLTLVSLLASAVLFVYLLRLARKSLTTVAVLAEE